MCIYKNCMQAKVKQVNSQDSTSKHSSYIFVHTVCVRIPTFIVQMTSLLGITSEGTFSLFLIHYECIIRVKANG